MIRAWKAFWDDLAAQLERHAAELRTGVTFIEAVAAETFDSELRALAGRDAAEYRRVATDAAKVGITPDEAREAFGLFVRGKCPGCQAHPIPTFEALPVQTVRASNVSEEEKR